MNNIHIWTDGSFCAKRNIASWGFVITKDGEVFHKQNGKIDNSELVKHRNVSGEIFAVVYGIEWAIRNGHFDISIFYDYNGVYNWISHWKTNNDLTKEYKKWINNKIQNLNLKIDWKKVKSHSKIELNDLADDLAKQGLESEFITSKFPECAYDQS